MISAANKKTNRRKTAMKDFDRIYLTGDTHADFKDLILKSIRYGITDRDLLIILGTSESTTLATPEIRCIKTFSPMFQLMCRKMTVKNNCLLRRFSM